MRVFITEKSQSG